MAGCDVEPNPLCLKPYVYALLTAQYVGSSGMSVWKEIQRDNLAVATVSELVQSTDALLLIADVTQAVNL
jgi:hypothetical protein